MSVRHSSLTGTALHEPKGVASASNKMVYIADGAGSGAWTYFPTGWEHSKDNASAQTFNTSAAQLSIDGAGSASQKSYLPPAIRASGALWNTTDDAITPIALGDAYSVRVDLPITAKSGSPNTILVQLDIGGTGSPSVVIVNESIAVPGSVPYTLTLSYPLFVGATFLANGCEIFLSTDTGTVGITAPAITIIRDHAGGI
jgi:hypothetical protein